MSTILPATETTVYLALELSCSSWLAAVRLPGRDKIVLHKMEAGDTAALLAFIATQRARARALTGVAVEVVSCYEAGRDGFWLHRLLLANDVINHVVEPTSILVNRRARRAKTDRLDAQGLLRVLAARHQGDHQICSVLRVPTPAEEDAKRPHREREHLVRERVRIENRIEALLVTQGIRKRPSLRTWDSDLAHTTQLWALRWWLRRWRAMARRRRRDHDAGVFGPDRSRCGTRTWRGIRASFGQGLCGRSGWWRPWSPRRRRERRYRGASRACGG